MFTGNPSAGPGGAKALAGILFILGIGAGTGWSAPGAIMEDGRRDPWLWPFASDSIWNMPIGDRAEYVPAGLERVGGFAIDHEILLRVAADAPERPLFAPLSWEKRAGGDQHLIPVRINDQDVVPDARQYWTPNFCAALLMPDNRTLRHLAPLCRPEPGGPVYGFDFRESDLHGDGILGSHGATRMSALGGSVRLGELTSSEPIRHAIKCCLFAKPYCYFGDDRKGFRWPAASADGYADQETYGGDNPAVVMGSLLALKPDADLADLKTPVGRKLAEAMRDYGCYIVDDAAHEVFYLCAERGVDEELAREFGHKPEEWDELRADIHLLLPLLHVVDNNGPDSIGGGGKPRAPLAPPLADRPAGEPPANEPPPERVDVSLVNPRMTEGEGKPTGWDGEWIGEGNAKIFRDTGTYHSAPAALAVEAVGGAAKAMAFQSFPAKGGKAVRVSARLRAEDGANAILAVQSFDAGWQGLDLKVVGNAISGADWVKAEGEVTLADGASRAAVVLIHEGSGISWLDDVSADGGDPGAGASPAAAARVKPPEPAKPEHSADPAEGFYPDYPQAWRQVVADQIALSGPKRVVFIGDSLTQGWNDQPQWKEIYEPMGVVNFGVGGDGTPQVLWRLQEGILDDLDPELVVLGIGLNNVWSGFDAADTVKGIHAVVNEIKDRAPRAKVLLLGHTHFFDKGDGSSRSRVREINAGQKELADTDERVGFLNFSEDFLTNDGELEVKYYASDKLHLSPAAYRVWAERMKAWLQAH